MVKKIKKFKINVRPSYVLRNLKKKPGLEAVPEPEDALIHQEIKRLEPWIVPSAVYETYSREETPELLKSLWDTGPEASSKKPLSVSLAAVTIGRILEEEIEKEQDKNRSALMESIARDALEQSLNFVEKLLMEEAKLDGCELSPFLPVGGGLLPETLKCLESHKAGVLQDAAGNISPAFTLVDFSFWIPLSKARSGKVH